MHDDFINICAKYNNLYANEFFNNAFKKQRRIVLKKADIKFKNQLKPTLK